MGPGVRFHLRFLEGFVCHGPVCSLNSSSAVFYWLYTRLTGSRGLVDVDVRRRWPCMAPSGLAVGLECILVESEMAVSHDSAMCVMAASPRWGGILDR